MDRRYQLLAHRPSDSLDDLTESIVRQTLRAAARLRVVDIEITGGSYTGTQVIDVDLFARDFETITRAAHAMAQGLDNLEVTVRERVEGTWQVLLETDGRQVADLLPEHLTEQIATMRSLDLHQRRLVRSFLAIG